MRYMTQITEGMLRLLVSASRWLLKRIWGYSSWDLVSAAINESGHSPSAVSCEQDPPPAQELYYPPSRTSCFSSITPPARGRAAKMVMYPPRTLPVPPPSLMDCLVGGKPKEGEDSRAISPCLCGPSCLLAQDRLVWSHSPIQTVQ